MAYSVARLTGVFLAVEVTEWLGEATTGTSTSKAIFSAAKTRRAYVACSELLLLNVIGTDDAAVE